MTDNSQPSQKEFKLQIELDADVAQGKYANLVLVNHSENEFVLDTAFVQPQQPKAKVHSRVILSPRNAKRFAQVLQHSIQQYESKFGAIPELVSKTPLH
jgi:hypothetical protein